MSHPTVLRPASRGSTDVFISYAREDIAFVHRLHEALKQKDRDTWVDWENIPPTAQWLKEIYSGIEKAHTFVFVISPDSAGSKVCGMEIDHAAAHNKRIVPILYRKVDPDGVHKSVGIYNWIFFDDPDNFSSSFELLINALDTDLDWTRFHTRLLVKAIEWNADRRDRSLILRGRDLKAAENSLMGSWRRRPPPTPLQTDYVRYSREQLDKQRNILLGLIALIVIATLVKIGMLGNHAAEMEREVQLYHYLEDLSLAQLTWRDGNVMQAIKIVQEPSEKEFRGVEWDYLMGVFQQRHPITLESQISTSSSLSFSSHDRIAAPSDHAIKVWKAATGERILTLGDHGDVGPWVSFFHDRENALITADQDHRVRIWSLDKRKPLYAYDKNPDPFNCIALSPDDNILAAATGHNIAIYDGAEMIALMADVQDTDPKSFSSFTGHRMVPIGRSAVGCLVFSPSGNQLLTGNNDGSVQEWDVNDLKYGSEHHPDSIRSGNSSPVQAIGVSPDGEILAMGCQDGRIILCKRLSHKTIAILEGHQGAVNTMAFSPDRKIMATGSDDHTVKLWSVPGRVEITSIKCDGIVKSVAFSASAQLAIGTENSITLWQGRNIR